MKSIYTLLKFMVLGLSLCQTVTVFAQKEDDKDVSKITPLFQKEEVLPITITSNIKAILKDRGDNPSYHFAALSYNDEHNEAVTIPMKMKVRGNFRRNTGNCSFPPLMLNFPSKGTKKTIFAKQDNVKLVTKCQREDYLFQEYFVYKIYNILSDLSFKARLVEVTYLDSLSKRAPEKQFGFVLENEIHVAKRNDAKNHYNKNIAMALNDSVEALTVTLFEYMIGNNDWSFSALHNIKLFIKEGKLFLPAPYDFDHAGIVEATYALPPPQLEIASVRERLYRGLNYPPSVFQQVFTRFNEAKPKIYAIYEGNNLLNPRYIKRTIKYLDDFYEAINDPKAIQKYFEAGRNKN